MGKGLISDIIKWIANILNDIKEERERKRLEETKQLEEERRRCQAKIDVATQRMTKKFCPIQRGPCAVKCVHFREGFVRRWTFHDGDTSFSADYPRCKLWSKEF